MSNTRKATGVTPAAPTPIGAAGYLAIADEGRLWTAPSGAVIRVRDLSIIDRALIDTLPNHLQEVVSGIIDQSDTLSGDKGDDDDDAALAMTVFGGKEKSLRSTLDNLYEIGNHFCIAAWIEPEVVPTAADVTDPERQIPAARILRDDRLAFVGHIFGMDLEESTKMATFPEQQG